MPKPRSFFASKNGRDPDAPWRKKNPTVNQTYIAAEICLDLQLEPRNFADSGEAHDRIKGQEGNPRFTREPPKPNLTLVAEMLR